MEQRAFLNEVLKVKGSRKHKVKNSYGVYDGFKYYRKNKPRDSKFVLTESQYFAIIRKINEALGEALISGEDIILPFKMGRLEVRKYDTKIYWDGVKIKSNLPIDWDSTLKFWFEDADAFKNKTLIRMEEKEVYRLYYNRVLAEYINKSFYRFNFNRDLKIRLKNKIKEGSIDAFTF